jgi:membrane protein involved in colicin uptake
MRRINLLRAHGSPTSYQYVHKACRCACCRAAQRAKSRDYLARHPGKAARDSKLYRQNHPEKWAAIKRAYRENNREKVLAAEKQYREEHAEERAANCRRWHDEHVEEQAEYARRYRAENAEKVAESRRRYLAANPEKAKEWARLWRLSHPEEYAAQQRNRRARMKMASGSHTAEDIAAQYARQKGKCYWRNVSESCRVSLADGYHVDHVVPLASGGSNGPENLVLACPTCNCSKQAKHPMDWSGTLF